MAVFFFNTKLSRFLSFAVLMAMITESYRNLKMLN